MTPDKAQELLLLRRELEADIRACELMRQDLKEKNSIRCGTGDFMDILCGNPDLMARFVLAVEHRNGDHQTRLAAINKQIGDWK